VLYSGPFLDEVGRTPDRSQLAARVTVLLN
jgi:hypothetical protein